MEEIEKKVNLVTDFLFTLVKYFQAINIKETHGIKISMSQYFVMDFSIASISLVFGFLMMLFGGVWGLYWWSVSIRTGISSTAGRVIIAALPLILGFQLFLQFLTSDLQNFPKKPKNHRGKNHQWD